jgi:erythromycin esterase
MKPVLLLEWARASLVPLGTDLGALGSMIGDARVVALSEGTHTGVEPLEFRNRLFRYLVEEKGFTAIAIESGLIESRAIHDYVRGLPGDLDVLAANNLSWGFDRLPQNRALIAWLRSYNSDPRHARTVNFYGFDMSGNPTSARAHWSQEAVLQEVFDFLSGVDAIAARVFRSRLEPLIPSTRFHCREPLADPCYGNLSQSQRDALTGAIADLIIWLERHEAKYTAASSQSAYAWAHQSAIAARQTDNFLRQHPVGFMTTAEERFADDELPAFISDASDVRDRVQADNLDWIAKQEGAAGKILVFAARYHLSAASVKVSWDPHRQEFAQEVAGTYLRRRFDDQLVTIGNLIGQKEIRLGTQSTWVQAPEHSLDGMARELGNPLFVLDLRQAPPPVRRLLEQEYELAAGSQRLKVPVGRAFDILFYVDTVKPAL